MIVYMNLCHDYFGHTMYVRTSVPESTSGTGVRCELGVSLHTATGTADKIT